MNRIDLNCDLGENAGQDEQLMPLISSANIACGGHSGDEITMRKTAALALRFGVAVGAHPGFEDRQNFGRRELSLSPSELRESVLKQIAALGNIVSLRHVKPHGALYNLAARDRAVADVIAGAVWEFDRTLLLFALAGSELVRAGRARGLVVAEEVFGDRSYRRDGSLTPRTENSSLIEDEAAVVAQVLRMVQLGKVRAIDGTDVDISADTLCLHGDGTNAVRLAQAIRGELAKADVSVKAITRT